MNNEYGIAASPRELQEHNMSFSQALDKLKGNVGPIRRESWEKNDFVRIADIQHGKSVYTTIVDAAGNEWTPVLADLFARDWEIYSRQMIAKLVPADD